MEIKRKVPEATKEPSENSKNGDKVDIQWGESMEPDLESESTDHLCKGRHCETAFEKF